MSDTVIRVENLSKQYRLGEHQGHKTFREAIVDSLKKPFINTLNKKPQSAIHNPQSETIWALKDASFEVKRGEVLGIIGRNGAGKSTLLKILSKITEPTYGRIEMRGRVGSLLEVGTGFHPELTGHENVYLYGAILGMDRWEVTRKFDEIVAFAEIEKFIETPVKRYSSGMYTRLAFSVAAHLDPEVLLVDEVLAVGDLGFQKKCLGKMDSVAGAGRTVLFVSHNMAAVNTLCHRAILLNSGCIVKDDRVESVIAQYRNINRASIGAHQHKPGLWKTQGDDQWNKTRILCVEIIDPNTNLRKENLSTGESVVFRLHYESRINLPDASFQFGISTNEGVVIMDYYTQPTDGVDTPITIGQGHIDCMFGQFPLAPGEYLLRVGIAHTMIKWLYRSFEFGSLCIEANYNSKGTRVDDSKRGLVHIDHSWRMCNEN